MVHIHLHYKCQSQGLLAILTVNISRKQWQIEQMLLLQTDRKSVNSFQSMHLHLTLANSNDQSQGYIHFYCEYLLNEDIERAILLSPTYRTSLIGFRMEYLHFTLARSKGQGQRHANVDFDDLVNGERRDRQIWLLPIHRKSSIGFRLVYLHLTLLILMTSMISALLQRRSSRVHRCSFLSLCSYGISLAPGIILVKRCCTRSRNYLLSDNEGTTLGNSFQSVVSPMPYTIIYLAILVCS